MFRPHAAGGLHDPLANIPPELIEAAAMRRPMQLQDATYHEHADGEKKT
jgi:hypothetical protein